jgi:hypothetical protein
MCEAAAPPRWNLACRIDDLLTEGLSISLSFSAPSARFADEVLDIACKATRDAAPRPIALRRLVDLVSTRDRTLTGGRCCPRGSALAVSRAICTAGCPCSRAHRSGPPCPAPVSEKTAGALRRALFLDTCIFSSSRHLLPGYAHWASYHPLDGHAGSLGVPWLVPWAGRFNLCAPWSPDDRTASRCLFRARGAVNSAVLPVLRWCYRLPLGPVPLALVHSACVVACPAVMMHRCFFFRTRQRTASARSTGQPSARQDALTMISRLLPHRRTPQSRALLGSAGPWTMTCQPLQTRRSYHS